MAKKSEKNTYSILAIIGKSKNEKLWSIGLTVSIVGGVVGMIFGAMMAVN